VTWTGFLAPPAVTPPVERWFDDDRAEFGFAMSVSRLWGYRPPVNDGLFALLGELSTELSMREKDVLVVACASARGDSLCSLAWGRRLSLDADPQTAAGDNRGDDSRLDPAEQALASWARKLVRDPNGVTAADVDRLRAAGYDDAAIFAITTFVALRLAFSTVNDALGVCPDPEFRSVVPPEVIEAIDYGRPMG
jgi:alkylhydroperoxidase family enzyme